MGSGGRPGQDPPTPAHDAHSTAQGCDHWGTAMTDMEHVFRAERHRRVARAHIAMEYVVVLAFVILVGAVVLAEVSGALDSFVHSISLLA